MGTNGNDGKRERKEEINLRKVYLKLKKSYFIFPFIKGSDDPKRRPRYR